MNRTLRLLSGLSLCAAGLVVVAQPATAAVDASCTFAKVKKLVTLSLPAEDHDEGDYFLGRVPGSKRIGFDSDDFDWKGCETATVENTNKIRVVGSQQSETLVITLVGGMIGPGVANEANGAAEIEIVGDLGLGTDMLVLLGGNGGDRLSIMSRTRASFNGDEDPDVTLDGIDEWEMFGGRGSDVLNGRGAPEIYIEGEEGGDRVTGGSGPDDLYGDRGEVVADGNDVIIGGAGDDNVVGGGGADELNGGADDDDLRGEKGNDSLKGLDGDDSIYNETYTDGADDISGGSGDDVANYYDRDKPLRLSLDGKSNDGARGEGDLVRGDIERVSGGDRSDLVVGNNADNTLYGNKGNDVLKGLGGNDNLYPDDGDDTMWGGFGDDYMPSSDGLDKHFGEAGDDYLDAGNSDDGRDVYSGGSGSDQIDYASRTIAVTIDVTAENGDGESGENDSVKSDFEYFYGGNASDVITGGPLAERLNGNAGSDLIDGGRGADVVSGGSGNDDLTGGEGRDYLLGDADDDLLFIGGDDAYDYGDCGSGSDTVFVDPYDDHDNCEGIVA